MFINVLRDGATLAWESGTNAHQPCPWDRILQPHREWGQGRRLAVDRRGTRIPRRLPRPSAVCVFMENDHGEDLAYTRTHRYRRSGYYGSVSIPGASQGRPIPRESLGSCGAVRKWRQLECQHRQWLL